jgi:hypothetical protein
MANLELLGDGRAYTLTELLLNEFLDQTHILNYKLEPQRKKHDQKAITCLKSHLKTLNSF